EVRDDERDPHPFQLSERGLPVGGAHGAANDILTDDRKLRLTEDTNGGGGDTRGYREADHPWLSATSCIGYCTENGNRQHDEERSDAVRDRIRRLGLAQIHHDPRREVEARDVHREDRVREVIERPAPPLACRRADDRADLALCVD